MLRNFRKYEKIRKFEDILGNLKINARENVTNRNVDLFGTETLKVGQSAPPALPLVTPLIIHYLLKTKMYDHIPHEQMNDLQNVQTVDNIILKELSYYCVKYYIGNHKG